MRSCEPELQESLVTKDLSAEGALVGVQKRGPLGLVTMQRAAALNAFSVGMAREMKAAVESLASDPSIWVVVARAHEGRAFSVGADLKESERMSADQLLDRRESLREMFASFRAIPQPSIASVFGFALGGGCELALSCDLIVAADDAVFGFPELLVGLVPAGGGTTLLPQAVGVRRAKEMMFTARRIDAAAARDLGLVSRVVPRALLDEATTELALEISRTSPSAARIVKRVVDESSALSFQAALALEEQGWQEASRTDDRREGVTAFLEKRSPQWRNR
jgi:enoyl-CoA hydratase/carnithine racemase